MPNKLVCAIPINFAQEEERRGEFEGILVKYSDEIANYWYKFKKGSMKSNNGKQLHILYSHNSSGIPLGMMIGEDREDGFYIKGKLDLSKEDGRYINEEAAKVYSLMKNGSKFDLSVGGFIQNYTEKKENERRFYLIENFDAYEGSICMRGAVKGSKITEVFNEQGGKYNMDMTREDLKNLLGEFTQNILNAQTDEEIKGLPAKFEELNKTFNEIKDTFNKETLDGFETKFNEINEILKGLKQGYTATTEEVSFAEEIASMMNFVSKKGIGVEEEFTSNSEVQFVASPGSTTTHDKTIKPTYVTKILERLQAVNPVLADINFLEIGDGSLYVPREMLGLPATGWIGETAQRTDTDINGIDSVTINLYQLYALPVISNRLMATNFVGYVNFLLKRVEYALGLTLANAVLNGSGTNQPKGILKEDGVAKMEIDVSADDKFADSLMDVYYSVRDEISSGAKWYMTRGTWAAISKLKNASKDFYITDLNTGNSRTLMTRPVVIVEDTENSGLKDIAKATATSDPVILFANLGMAMQGIQNNKLNMSIKDQITTKGLTKYYFEKLVGVGTQLPEYAVIVAKKE